MGHKTAFVRSTSATQEPQQPSLELPFEGSARKRKAEEQPEGEDARAGEVITTDVDTDIPMAEAGADGVVGVSPDRGGGVKRDRDEEDNERARTRRRIDHLCALLHGGGESMDDEDLACLIAAVEEDHEQGVAG